MSSPVPRLINFSEKVQNSLENRLRYVKQELNDIEIAYVKFVNDMKSQACEKNGYWTFDLDIVSVDDVSRWCEFDPDVVVSQYWRLVGSFEDIVSLAKLLGRTYQHHGKEVILPGFGPEDSYWIRSLQMMKICHGKSVDPDINRPCSNVLSKETPLLWKFAPPQDQKFKLCKCCTDDMCQTKSQTSTRPFSPITPVIISSPTHHEGNGNGNGNGNGKCNLARNPTPFISGLSPVSSESLSLPSEDLAITPETSKNLENLIGQNLPSVKSVTSVSSETPSFNKEFVSSPQEIQSLVRKTNPFNKDLSFATPVSEGTPSLNRTPSFSPPSPYFGMSNVFLDD